MATLAASGTQTAVIDTEHTLATITDPGTYQLVVDANAMAAGDIVELRVKTKCLVGGTTRLAHLAVYQGVQGEPIKLSVPIMSDQEYVATLTQTDGTGRAYPWKVLAV